MILADTSVWIDHFRHGNNRLAELLNETRVLMHPFVLGELAMGNLSPRATILEALKDLPSADMATDTEVRLFVEQQTLFARGIGYIDAHLLTAVRLTPGTFLWTQDKRLATAAQRLRMVFVG